MHSRQIVSRCLPTFILSFQCLAVNAHACTQQARSSVQQLALCAWVQLSDIAARGEHDETRTNPHVVNMLRGGVLYAKVRKPQEVLPGTPDLPSKASQVGDCHLLKVGLCWHRSVLAPASMPSPYCMDMIVDVELQANVCPDFTKIAMPTAIWEPSLKVDMADALVL